MADRACNMPTTTRWCWNYLGLPGLDGHGVVTVATERDQRLPALILTARDRWTSGCACSTPGADDFLAKPFELAELEARLRPGATRTGQRTPQLACGSLVYDGQRKRFHTARRATGLVPRELAVLRVLVQRSGGPFSKQQILDRCSLTTKTFTRSRGSV